MAFADAHVKVWELVGGRAVSRDLAWGISPTGIHVVLTACRKEAKYSCPLLLTGPYHLEGTTLAKRLAASRNHKHSCTRPPLKAMLGGP